MAVLFRAAKLIFPRYKKFGKNLKKKDFAKYIQ
jgi:hypothetical protein